jgi:hypothetical protein
VRLDSFKLMTIQACCVKRACTIVARPVVNFFSVFPASQLAEHVQSSTNGHLFGVHISDIFLLLLKPFTETSFTDEPFVLIALLLNRSVYVDHHHYMSRVLLSLCLFTSHVFVLLLRSVCHLLQTNCLRCDLSEIF